MTQTLTEGTIAYDFPSDWMVTQYDEWAFYRNQFQNCCTGNKAVDFVCYDNEASEPTLWLIELKDYRQSSRSKPSYLWNEVAIKARDTLAGLFAARCSRISQESEKAFAERVAKARRLRLVLHLEQPHNDCKLFRRVYNPANVAQKIRQLVKPIDAHPLVIELNNMCNVPCTARSVSA